MVTAVHAVHSTVSRDSCRWCQNRRKFCSGIVWCLSLSEKISPSAACWTFSVRG